MSQLSAIARALGHGGHHAHHMFPNPRAQRGQMAGRGQAWGGQNFQTPEELAGWINSHGGHTTGDQFMQNHPGAFGQGPRFQPADIGGHVEGAPIPGLAGLLHGLGGGPALGGIPPQAPPIPGSGTTIGGGPALGGPPVPAGGGTTIGGGPGLLGLPPKQPSPYTGGGGPGFGGPPVQRHPGMIGPPRRHVGFGGGPMHHKKKHHSGIASALSGPYAY